MEDKGNNKSLLLEIALNEVVRLRGDITQLKGVLSRVKKENNSNRVAHAEIWRAQRSANRAKAETERLFDILATNDLSRLKGDELRLILEKKGLSTKGKNAELIARIHKDNTNKKS